MSAAVPSTDSILPSEDPPQPAGPITKKFSSPSLSHPLRSLSASKGLTNTHLKKQNKKEKKAAPSTVKEKPTSPSVTTTKRTVLSMWAKKKKELAMEDFPSIIDGIKKIYSKRIRPLEELYKFDQFYSPLMRDSDFDAKPQVLLLGQYSTGKTSFIRYLLERDFPGQHIGPEPTTDRFSAIMWGPEDMITPGNALAVQADKPFSALSRFGTDFLNKFQGSNLNVPILEDLTFVDTPGVLSGEKQRIGRSYDFVEAVEWFAGRSDLIFLLFDAHKLDISDEFKRTIEALKGHDDKVRIILNKADMINGQQLMRVYGALMWSLGKVFKTPEVMRVYIGSFWEQPYQNDENKKLFEAEREDLLKDLHSLPRMGAVRKINELVKRARLAKVHAYIISHLKEQMPAMFGKEKKQAALIDNLNAEFNKIHKAYQLPVGDFPDLIRFKERVSQQDFTKFPKLHEKLIADMDRVLGEEIPNLLKKFPQEKAEKMGNPFESEMSNPFDEDDDNPITSDDRIKSNEIFNSLHPVNGKLAGKVVKEALSESKQSSKTLSKIWVLSDRDKDGQLNQEEFAIAMWLVNLALAEKPLPEELPAALQLKTEK